MSTTHCKSFSFFSCFIAKAFTSSASILFASSHRELSIMCRSSGIVLSADDYVPQDYSKYYRRDVQGKVCDYVIIMGYDEHTSGSEEAGSVASIDFVMQGIEDTLKDVPANKVINAVPFYTRVWKEEAG